jgi:hypothetical protein
MTSNPWERAPSEPRDGGGRLALQANRRRLLSLACVFALLVLGIGLRSTQYYSHVDMWVDELALARNVEDRGLVGLVSRPLDHYQVAPVGTLVLLEASSTLLGVSEVGLRFGPWILGIASMLLFWRVATRFAEGAPLLAALAVFAVSPALVWYGSSLKPYGGDVAVSLFLVLLSLRFLERPDNLGRGVIAGALGGSTLLLSFPAIPTAAILAVLLAVAWCRRSPRPPVAPLANLGVGWMLGAAFAAWAALRLVDPATEQFMREFWADDFPPTSHPLAALTWGLAKLYAAFAHSVVVSPPRDPVLQLIVAVPVVLAVVGLVFAFRPPTVSSLLLLAPPVAGLAAAFLHLLPFDQRLALHATWPLLVLAALGLTRLHRILPGRWRLATHALSTVVALPLVAIVLLAARPPYEPFRLLSWPRAWDGVQPHAVLTNLAQRRRPADRIYVYTGGRHDMAFYGKRAGIEDWMQGERHYDDPRGYLREVDVLRGEPRVWFFWVRLDRDEPALIRSYLGTIGRELERIPAEPLSATGAVLYDLSDTERSGRISAESFPLSDSAGKER